MIKITVDLPNNSAVYLTYNPDNEEQKLKAWDTVTQLLRDNGGTLKAIEIPGKQC